MIQRERIIQCLRKAGDVVIDVIYYGFIATFICGTVLLAGEVFIASSFRIPTDSMEPTIEPGDDILICKPVLGARLFNVFSTLRREQVRIYRAPGWRDVERGDVLVFNFPHPNRWDTVSMHVLKYYVKRCVALPGDSVSIRGGYYQVSNAEGEELGNIAGQRMLASFRKEDIHENVYGSYPNSEELNWNIKDFGPLYIPQSGDSLEMNRRHFLLYHKYIAWETGKKVTMNGDAVMIEGKAIAGYRFRKSYYFTAGDNVMNSQDSRYWGLLPEEYIAGKAWFIWRSRDPHTGDFRWDRFLKRVE